MFLSNIEKVKKTLKILTRKRPDSLQEGIFIEWVCRGKEPINKEKIAVYRTLHRTLHYV